MKRITSKPNASLLPTASYNGCVESNLAEHSGSILLPGVALIQLQGADVIEWLQGQATNDVRPLSEGQPVSFCLCSPTGQMRAVVDAIPKDDAVFLTCPIESRGHVLSRVEEMVIMEDVVAEDLTDEYLLISIQGHDANAFGPLNFPNDRTGYGGIDNWLPRGDQERIDQILASCPSISTSTYNMMRLEAGIPFWGIDMDEKTLPPELGRAFESRHVSYNKGCYVGQEILMRIFSRGHTNKTWKGLVADGPLEIGAQIDGFEKPNIGTVTSTAHSKRFGHIGAAMLRNEFATPGQSVLVQTERGEIDALVREMPF